MGFLDVIKGKIDQADKAYNPLRKVGDTLQEGFKGLNGNNRTPQEEYEARERAMNAKNPAVINVGEPIKTEPIK